MATVNLSSWYPDVSPYVNGCPLAVQLAKIREAAIAFCKGSRAWRFTAATPLNVTAAQQTYPVSTDPAQGALPAGSKVTHIYEALFNGAQIEVMTPEDFKAQAPETWMSDQGDPESFTLFMDGELSLYPIPAATTAAALALPDVALTLTQAATTIDARLYEEHRMAIAKGARARIHSIPKKPYTDLQLGMALEQEFQAAIGAAQARTSSARGHARLRTVTNIRR